MTERFLLDGQWEAALYRPETVPDHLLVVAEIGGAFAGCGNLFPGSEGRKDRHVANLGIYILKPYREKGIGAQMMAWMLDWAKEAGLEKITLAVLANNQRAIRLYQKFGFEIEGIRRRQYRIGSEYVDSILMARFLS